MIEIFLVLVLGFLAAAHKRKPRRYRGTWRKVPIDFTLVLDTLANNDLLGGVMTNNAIDSLRAMSLEGTWSIEGGATGAGPVTVGVAHGDYSDAEIEEWYEAIGSMNRSDKVAAEQASRFCRRVGSFAGLEANAAGGSVMLNDGLPVKTRLNWLISPGLNIKAWAHNDTGATLPTGVDIHFQGVLNILFVD